MTDHFWYQLRQKLLGVLRTIKPAQIVMINSEYKNYRQKFMDTFGFFQNKPKCEVIPINPGPIDTTIIKEYVL